MSESSKVVFAGNLSWTTSDEDLLNYVGGAGKVVKATVQRHADTGRSKGWGLIEFADAPSASAAIEQFDFNELNGRKVHLRLDRSSVSVPDDACRVFVGNLPWEANDDMLASLFAQYGPIDCSVKTNMTGKSRGFGIVTFKSVEQAERAITETQNKELSGRALECRMDRGPGAARTGAKKIGPKASVFVGNLPDQVDSDALTALFTSVAPVANATVRTQTAGGSSWGLVRFSSPSDADRAIASFNGIVTTLGPDPLLVRYDRR